jgi:hypothetical protein
VARGSKSQASEDLWHLSISDLLATPKERASPAGSGPVVINLSTSTAHIGAPPKGMRGFDGLHLYQLRRGTQDAPLYLLRLGIITTDIEADAILSSVLEHYPGATKASPEDDDRAAIAERADAASRQKSVPASAPPPNPAAKRTEARPPAPKAAPARSVAAAKPPDSVRWDVDELLPDLAVTRPSRPEAPSPAPPASVIEATFDPPATSAPEPGVLAVPEPVVETQAPLPPGTETETVQPIEIELAAPESAAPPPRHVDDSNAITHEVPLPTFEFDAPEMEVPGPATPEVSIAYEVAPTIEVERSCEEPPTIEVQAVEVLTVEVQAAAEAMAVTIELPAPVAPVHEEPPTIEVQSALEEPPTIEVQAAEVLTVEVRAAEAIVLDVEFPAPIEVVAAVPPEPASDASAETLEQLVARIDAMVESVDQHDKESLPGFPESAPPAPEPSNAPRIESTQTLHTLTTLELSDEESSPWFSIQLTFSEAQIDPEQVPDLDLFNEYRLYSVSGLHDDRVMHALRLGFFSSELAAEAVAGYLRGFFDEPCIKRVSVAERERFAEQTLMPRKDIGATGVHAVIELTSPKALPERQRRVFSKSMGEARPSIWSRLVAPLKR